MPEGPSLVIMREAARKFRGKAVRTATGNSSLDLSRMHGRRVVSVRSWGKHFLLEFRGFSLRVHMLLFGSYLIDSEKLATPRMSLKFDNGVLNVYASSLKYIEGALDEVYDWHADVLSPEWNAKLARRKLKAQPDVLACDALLDQNIFAGVGNIIKNEVLFRIRLHPASRVGEMSAKQLGELIAQAREYSFDFLAWKKAGVLKRHWLVHGKKTCPNCERRLTLKELGTRKRRAFFCSHCQRMPGKPG
ncbi:DNA-formamidopyrimidine glycosylase family protein [Pseudoxanthomonas japonensis]|uniref:DNA-formamidopyrimidine glycosylase family protein n=1 Tax=Pseudoxanthomonas japonensis TaxID=69284 RepID=UPI001BCD367D|nr:DNA-formamidopyrimidine glycosylase family protein [Pseudoxanthomonas japonensis]